MGKNELLEPYAYKEGKRKHIRLLRHQMALIKLRFDGLSVSDPYPCGLNFPRSTHGLKNQKERGLGSVSLGPSQTPNALLFSVPGGTVTLGFL